MKKPMIWLLIFALLLPALALGDEAVAPTVPTPGEDVAVKVPGERWAIPATVCLPEGDGPFPFIVMFHGTGSNRDEAGDGYKMLAPKLAEAGIASIRFDFVGNGDSEGDYMSYTFSSGISDGEMAILYMKSLPQIDAERYGVLGWSQGGTVAMLTAARNPEVKSLVTWAGAVDMSGFAADLYEAAKENGYAVLTFEWRDSLNLSIDWFEEAHSTNVAEELANYQGAVLAIAGSLDDVVPLSDLDTIVDSAAGTVKEAFLLDGADHTFNVFSGDLSLYEQLAEKTVTWFKDTL